MANHHLPCNLETIKGLNQEVNPTTQFKIGDHQLTLIQKSGLEKII